MSFGIHVRSVLAVLGWLATAALAQPCLEKNLQYWQAFPPGGESDLSARHQQAVLRKKCAAIETIVQYKLVYAGTKSIQARLVSDGSFSHCYWIAHQTQRLKTGPT